eukprot:2888588-Rhodomonas_salina.1
MEAVAREGEIHGLQEALTKCQVPLPATLLRASYAMPAMHAAYGTQSLSECYAILGTHVRRHVRDSAVCLRACYALSGTELGYAGTRKS